MSYKSRGLIEDGIAERERLNKIFDYDEKLDVLTIKAAYPYHIEMSRIPDFESLLNWLHHLTEKEWMTRDLVTEMISVVYGIKGWTLYRRPL